MSQATYTIFSMHLGALLALMVGGAYDGFMRHSRPSRGATGYFTLSAATSSLGSGWVATSLGVEEGTRLDHALSMLFVLSALVTAWAGLSGARRWLGFPWRGPGLDRILRGVQALLRAAALVALAFALLSPWFEQFTARHLKLVTWMAGGLAVCALLACAWVCYRMAQLSDRLSLWLTWATVLTIPGILGVVLYQASGVHVGAALWGLVTFAHAVAMLCTAYAALQQNMMHNARQRTDASASNFDALGRAALGERLSEVFAPKFDRLNTRRVTPAVLVVNVFNHDRIAADLGPSAADQTTLATLARLRRVLNPHDLLGCYFDSCFVVLIRAQVDAHYLREVCLRVAASVCRDVALRGVTAAQNDHASVSLEVGVGLCWSDRVAEFSQALAQAGAAASAARSDPGKACVVLYPDRPPLPVGAVLGSAERITQPPRPQV